jgi:hypothetical protein
MDGELKGLSRCREPFRLRVWLANMEATAQFRPDIGVSSQLGSLTACRDFQLLSVFHALQIE